MAPSDVVLCAPVQSAIGTYGGTLKGVPASEVGAAIIRATLERAALQGADVETVVMGQVVQAGSKMNPARQATMLVGTGLYFLILRPPLLPEDVRFMGVAAQLDPVRPRLEAWLAHVFRVMGGYVLATGVLTVTLAATSFRQHSPIAALGALVSGAASIGWMAMVNFLIGSEFKWVLLGMVLVWAFSLGLFGWELLQGGSAPRGAFVSQKSYGDT